MNHGLLLFFNHPYRKVRVFLEQYYKDRFAKIHVLTPPEGPAENTNPDVTYFYDGSYNFGGAFSHMLSRPDVFAGMDWVTVLHDDVVIHPDFPHNVESRLADGVESLSPPIDPNFNVPGWPWDARMISRAFFPRHPVMGDGTEAALKEMKELYEMGPGARGASTRFSMSSRDLFSLGVNGSLARWLKKSQGSLTADFGVPISKANSDFFMVRQDRFHTFCHYAGVLTRCGLFVEAAIPSALRWLATKPREFAWEELDWSRVSDELNRKHFQIDSLADIAPHFEKHPRKLAVHPIKMSRLIPK